jgi:hypothetical protein
MKMIKMFLALITLSLLACNPKSSAVSNSKVVQKIEILAYYQSSGKLGYLVESVKIDGDKLIFNIVYAGGCKPHTFKLIGDSSISSSKPAQTNLYLVHDNNGDNCTNEIKKEIIVDIARLKNMRVNPIELNIDNLNTVLYKY